MNRILAAALLFTTHAAYSTQARDNDPATEPPCVEVRVSFVRFAHKVIERETTMQNTGVLPHADVMALWKAGKGELLHTLSLVTRSGVAAEVQHVEEITYGTEYVVSPAVDPKDKTGQRVLPLLRPSNFETRKVGFILNVTPTVLEGGEHIALTLAPEHSWIEDWADVAPDLDGSAFGSVEMEIELPVIGSRNMTTSIVLKNGESQILGGGPAEDGEWVHYMVMSASLP